MQLILYFFSDPSVRERWFRNKSIYLVLHWKQTLCTWKQKQSTDTDTFFLRGLGYYCWVASRWKDLTECFSLQRTSQEGGCFQGFQSWKFFWKIKQQKTQNWQNLDPPEVNGNLKTRIGLEFWRSTSLEYYIYVLLAIWNCSFTEIPVARCSSFMNKWSGWFFLSLKWRIRLGNRRLEYSIFLNSMLNRSAEVGHPFPSFPASPRSTWRGIRSIWGQKPLCLVQKEAWK